MGNRQNAALADPLDEPRLVALSRAVIQSQDIIVREQTAVIASLEAQSARYETAIENVSQGVSFFDAEGRLIRCNRRFAEIYGLAPDEVHARRRAARDRRTPVDGRAPGCGQSL